MQEILKPSKLAVADRTTLHYLIVLSAALTLYVLSCAPGLLWQDSALLSYRVWHNDIEGDMGLALSHPLYMMMGIIVKYIPVGELAYKLNLLSALLGALAVANLFLFVRLWLGRDLPAIVAAISLALSWTFWQNAVMAEVYTLSAALLFVELIALLQYSRTRRVGYLYLLGLFNGLAIANHLWGLLPLVCYGVFWVLLLVRREIRPKHLAVILLLWIAGAAPYEYLIVKNIILSGDVPGTISSALFGRLWQGEVLNTSVSVSIAVQNFAFVLLNFPTPNLVFFFVGLWALRKASPSRGFAIILVAMLILYFVFAFRYTVVDRYVFFIPFYCLAAVLIALGADMFLRRARRNVLVFAVAAFAFLPALVYVFTPGLARKTYKSLGQRRQRPYRDEYTYFLQPWKTGYLGAQKFADEALGMVEPGAIIYADATVIHTLLYAQQAQDNRPDVKIVSGYYASENAPDFSEDTISQLMNESAVYVVSAEKTYCPEFILKNYSTVKRGVLYQVREKTNVSL
ncbi:MAG: protein O-mannosyl-transferase family [Planctomycetota bacterium]|jgi:hypothetical protein